MTDNGTGLDELTKGRLFDTFYTTKPQGLGLGSFLEPQHRRSAWRKAMGGKPAGRRCCVSIQPSFAKEPIND